MSDDTNTRDDKGRFLPGSPPGPGRPKRTDAEAVQREAIRAALPGIVNRLIESAEGGDIQASRLLLDRVMPALKATDAPVSLPPGIDASDLTGAPTAVLKALASGDLSPDQAATIAGALSALVKVREITELESRIAALKAKQGI
ncbi:hypothetical protein [uncultured Thiodictyon sp.]|uniref:hypothetical protein n=1 Tax=uncultured Thiodictyon sp. TaxID=1846217 RepID=UPI0025FA8C0C|nr:hypothetical protein [uncultured Thiodictyon sp.]